VQEICQAGLELGEARWFGLAFPDGEELPAEAAEGAAGAFVACGVVLDFGEPVIAAGGWDASGTAGVGVPEAAARCLRNWARSRQINLKRSRSVSRTQE
jgi:hypothetical protein